MTYGGAYINRLIYSVWKCTFLWLCAVSSILLISTVTLSAQHVLRRTATMSLLRAILGVPCEYRMTVSPTLYQALYAKKAYCLMLNPSVCLHHTYLDSSTQEVVLQMTIMDADIRMIPLAVIEADNTTTLFPVAVSMIVPRVSEAGFTVPTMMIIPDTEAYRYPLWVFALIGSSVGGIITLSGIGYRMLLSRSRATNDRQHRRGIVSPTAIVQMIEQYYSSYNQGVMPAEFLEQILEMPCGDEDSYQPVRQMLPLAVLQSLDAVRFSGQEQSSQVVQSALRDVQTFLKTLYLDHHQ
jgi:hypothetical protein